MKFTLSGYYQPTPKKIKKLADSVVTGCTFAGGAASLNNQPIIGTIIFVLGYLAKIASDFFTEDPQPIQNV